MSIKKRKLIEEIFGGSKSIGRLRKARFVGLTKLGAQTTLTFAAYNLTRMATFCKRGTNPRLFSQADR